MLVAYLVNEYPKVSHTFIRREILALERQGFEIMRISIRGWDSELVDETDLAERAKTRYVLRSGWLAIAVAVVAAAVSGPFHFRRALALAIRVGWKADRPLPYHLIYLVEACLIRQWLAKSSVQHVHAHFGTNSAEVAMLVRLLGGPPWSFTVHGPEEFDKHRSISLAEKIHRAAFVVAVSSYGRSQLFRLVDHHIWHKIHVVRCGLEPTYFEQPAMYRETRHLVCIGRFCEQKGQLLLVEAARRLSESGIEFSLTLAGDGELRREIETLIERYGLSQKVQISGWISTNEVQLRILEARALVLPSFAEGLPVAITEAMALHRPVISTFIAGIPELVQDGKHGWLVPSGDIDALVDAITQCLTMPLDVLQRMSDAGFERAASLHNVDTETSRLASLIKNDRGAEATDAIQRWPSFSSLSSDKTGRRP